MPRLRSTSGRVVWWVEGETTPSLEALLADPDRVLSGPGSLARPRTGRKRFWRLSGDGSEPALLVKEFRVTSAGARLRSLLRPSKARREARVARAVQARAFDAAAPLAVGEERRFGAVARSLSVIREREGTDLRALLLDPATPDARRRALVEGLADLARRLHDAGVDQDDFSPNNFLVTRGDAFVLLDFERCSIGAPLQAARRWRILAKLHRHDLGVSAIDRMRFLRRYLGPEASRADRHAAWRAIRAEFLRVRARDARRAARAAFRVGRNVVREGDAWVVRGREGRPVVRLELGPERARDAWVRAHQLERLALPALRPVRLGAGFVELEEPKPAAPPSPARRAALEARATRRFRDYGRFVSKPGWRFAERGALLADPLAFELAL
jgi:hypothetical protein